MSLLQNSFTTSRWCDLQRAETEGNYEFAHQTKVWWSASNDSITQALDQALKFLLNDSLRDLRPQGLKASTDFKCYTSAFREQQTSPFYF